MYYQGCHISAIFKISVLNITPEITSDLKFIIRIFTFLGNLQFVFQGSQKMHVRVAISQKFSEEEFQFPTRNISKIIGKSATVVAFLVDFVD